MTPILSRPANVAIGGMNCTIIALFGVNLDTAEGLPPLVMTLNIPEPINPANIIVSVIEVPPTFIPIK
jgi:hypothetical protein